MAFNAQDPAYQRAIQRARAANSMGPTRLTRPMEAEITRQHAGYQESRGLAFERLGLSKRLADQEYELSKARADMNQKRIGLAEDRLAWDKKRFTKDIKDQDNAVTYSIFSGLLGTGLGYYEGQQRSKMLAEETVDRKLTQDLYRQNLKKQTEFMEKAFPTFKSARTRTTGPRRSRRKY